MSLSAGIPLSGNPVIAAGYHPSPESLAEFSPAGAGRTGGCLGAQPAAMKAAGWLQQPSRLQNSMRPQRGARKRQFHRSAHSERAQ